MLPKNFGQLNRLLLALFALLLGLLFSLDATVIKRLGLHRDDRGESLSHVALLSLTLLGLTLGEFGVIL